jgi:Fur family ferric uptake transcriptional regulator
MSATAVTQIVQASYPSIDASTVYRTLSTAADLGLIERFEQTGKEIAFEWRSDEHHHLVCQRCGRVSLIDNQALAPLVTSLQSQEGFSADLRHVALSGTCRECGAQA